MNPPETKTAKYLIGIAIAATVLVLGFLGKRWLVPLFERVLQFVGQCWHWLWAGHTTPGWLLVLVVPCAALVVFQAAYRLFANVPSVSDFTEMPSDHLIWKWNNGPHGEVFRLATFCPQPGCGMQILSSDSSSFNRSGAFEPKRKFQCDRNGCNYSHELPGTQEDIESKIEREIYRVRSTGEWVNFLKK